VHGNNARGTDASNEAISVVNTDGFEIVGNDVRDNGEEGIDAKYEARNGVIHGNRATGNRGPNIYIDSAHDIEVIGNFVAGATEASKSGIGLAVENYSDTLRLADITIRDNQIEDNAGASVDFWIEGEGSMSGVTVADNQFSSNGRGAITFHTNSFSGDNSIIGNTFTGGDQPPTAIDGITTDAGTEEPDS
jgi:parallel beta-helix repeat protein